MWEYGHDSMGWPTLVRIFEGRAEKMVARIEVGPIGLFGIGHPLRLGSGQLDWPVFYFNFFNGHINFIIVKNIKFSIMKNIK